MSPVTPAPGRPAGFRAGVLSSLHIIRGIIAELSDETRYQRHLEHHNKTHSPAEWRRFQDEQWQARQRRGRCC